LGGAEKGESAVANLVTTQRKSGCRHGFSGVLEEADLGKEMCRCPGPFVPDTSSKLRSSSWTKPRKEKRSSRSARNSEMQFVGEKKD